MKICCYLFPILLFFGQTASGQEIRDQKEAERLYRESLREAKYYKLYYDDDEKCRGLIRDQRFQAAEAACRLAISHSDKLSKERYLERSSGRIGLGVALLRLRREREATVQFQSAYEVTRPALDDTNSETGEIYFLLGQAYHLLDDRPNAELYYEKAEKTYRAAFVAIGDEEMRRPYARAVRSIVEAHFILLENAEMAQDAAKMREHFEKVRQEYSKYLD
ncbi:MAG: tetratricopeptide repeat protein [Acidobacteriota bacterium]